MHTPLINKSSFYAQKKPTNIQEDNIAKHTYTHTYTRAHGDKYIVIHIKSTQCPKKYVLGSVYTYVLLRVFYEALLFRCDTRLYK